MVRPEYSRFHAPIFARMLNEVSERERMQPKDAEFAALLNISRPSHREWGTKNLIEAFDKYVLKEDNDILLVNKPSRIISHASRVNKFGVEEIARYKRGEIYLVNRLDIDTTGIIVLAKNEKAFLKMKEQFLEKEKSNLQKLYLTFLDGEFTDSSIRKEKLGLREGEPKVEVFREYDKNDRSIYPTETHFTPLALFQTVGENPRPRTLTLVQIITGRKHQIRATAAQGLGMPVTGDRNYNGDPRDAGRPLLHSFGIGFNHPRTGERVLVEAPIPDDFNEIISHMKQVKSYSRKKNE